MGLVKGDYQASVVGERRTGRGGLRRRPGDLRLRDLGDGRGHGWCGVPGVEGGGGGMEGMEGMEGMLAGSSLDASTP